MKDIILVDSIAMATSEHTGKVIVSGSHGGLVAGKCYALPIRPLLVVFNDAGFGKNNAGIGGVVFLGENQIAAASVDTMTAMIGDSNDMYQNGVLSYVNPPAEFLGLKIGMTVKEAAKLVVALKEQD